MDEIILLVIIGLSLSIDAFSVSTCIGMYNIKNKKAILISTIVGLFHFFMPLFGLIISNKISNIIEINNDIVLGIILIIISLQMFIEYIHPSNKNLKLNKVGMFLFAIGVSLDSFSVGMGLNAITKNYMLASFIFSIISASFTYLGIIIGKYISSILKKYSYLLGTLLLFIIGIYFICKYI